MRTFSLAPRFPFLAAALLAALALATFAGCAGFKVTTKNTATAVVQPSERLFLAVAPFDSTVRAELAEAGLDPARVREELAAELRYQFALRKQEEARDSTTAAVVVVLTVRHLQPGSANTGTYGAFTLDVRRSKGRENLPWTWEARAKDNVPAASLERHVVRGVAAGVMARLPAKRTRSSEPPPPLMLMF